MTAYNTDVQATIDRCKELVGQDESRITIDILQITAPNTSVTWDAPAKTAYSNYERGKDLKDATVGSDQLDSTKRAHPNINFRHQIVLKQKTTGLDELSFEQTVLQPLIDIGKQDAKTALNMKSSESDLFLN